MSTKFGENVARSEIDNEIEKIMRENQVEVPLTKDEINLEYKRRQ